MKEWFATLIDDLKFLGTEFKREFSDLEIRQMTAEEIRRRRDEMHRSSVAGKLARGILQIRDGKLTPYGMGRNKWASSIPGSRASKPGKISLLAAVFRQITHHAAWSIVIHYFRIHLLRSERFSPGKLYKMTCTPQKRSERV